ncbi:MAG: YciI family protein [Thermomicrobiales bacterium]|nr:YciI family protein [Thermomicrobiales bacterium]
MRYILLIYGDEEMYGPPVGTPEADALLEEYFALSRALRTAGINEPSDEIDGPATATTVRVRNGELLVSDGPFIESKEQLGGFYIVEADSVDEAAGWAAQIPGARTGGIEIRPLVDYSEGA